MCMYMYNWLLPFGDPRFVLLQQMLENAIDLSHHIFSMGDSCRLLCQQKLQLDCNHVTLLYMYLLCIYTVHVEKELVYLLPLLEAGHQASCSCVVTIAFMNMYTIILWAMHAWLNCIVMSFVVHVLYMWFSMLFSTCIVPALPAQIYCTLFVCFTLLYMYLSGYGCLWWLHCPGPTRYWVFELGALPSLLLWAWQALHR